MSFKAMLLLLMFSSSSVLCKECYWNRKCSYDLFGTVTPYDSARDDLRDQPKNTDCEVLSVWSVHRHGNRNPGSRVVLDVNALQSAIKQRLADPLLKRRANGCSQDMSDLINWNWNSTVESSASYLTGTGYEELYNLGRRVFLHYSNFLESVENVHFRATDEQRTATSVIAFVHGLSAGSTRTNLSSAIAPSVSQDNVIRPYENCERYQEEVKDSQLLADELAAYDSNPEYIAIRDRVQAKLFVDYEITTTEIFALYELCRFDRTWSPRLKSPWCAFFTDEDLIVLEYRDDVRHFYKNGYGSWINSELGAVTLRDLYEKFSAAVEGNEKSMVSYFTHDTMMDMIYCALELYKDPEPLRGSTRRQNRLWRTSQFAAFSSNLIAILSRCVESGVPTHRVQILINEKPTALCPEEGCTWPQFVSKFQRFGNATLDFCAKRRSDPGAGGRADTIHSAASLMALVVALCILRQ